ncbi:MAG: DUF6768 family protein [Acidobacteriota bacterium]
MNDSSKHEAKNIDALIHEALSQEEAELYDQLGEQSLLEMFSGSFQGRNRWLTIIAFVFGAIEFVLAIYCAVRFFQATETQELLKWLGGFFLFMMMNMALKLWHWMELHKNAITREVKRLELQVAHLASQLRDREAPG